MQLLVAAVRPPELVEQLDEKLVVSAFSGDPVEAPRLEVERPGNPHLAVGTRGAQGLLFPSAHPAKAHFGVGLQLGLVLEKGPRLLVICRTSSSLACFSMICSSESFSGGTGRGLLQRKPRRCSARRMVSRLTQTSLSLSLRSCTASSLQLQRERSQPCSMGESSSSSFSTRSFASCPSNGLGPRGRRSSKAARPSPTKRDTTA